MSKLTIADFGDEPKEEEYFPDIYRAMPTIEVGLTLDNEIVSGLKLSKVAHGSTYDALQNTIENVGIELVCNMPVDGLEEGGYYEIIEKCTSVDWETGYCDDTELYVNKVA